ncbi:MAG: hypothetical protein IPJ41_02445 [Phycisphaerales bacterium]|nr:hypothetical protein [Phycisphaerales bacterium]
MQVRTFLSVLALIAPLASADIPHMGGEMNHVLVSVYQQTVYVTVERPEEMPLTLFNYHEHYTGAAGVLNRSGYNAQFGWLAGGFISLPPDAGVWIEALDQTPGLRTYSQYGFDPLFGTADSPTRWQWDGTMTHNWYAATMLGDYQATYSVYVGTLDGSPYPGYTPGGISLAWSYLRGGLGTADGSDAHVRDVRPIPAPGELAILPTLAAFGRRRRG